MSRAMLPADERSAAAWQTDDRKVGEIFAAWRVTPNSLMLLGWQHERPASEGTAALQRPDGARGRFVGAAWPVIVGRNAAYRFLAAVQLPHSDVPPEATVLLTGKRAVDEAVLARLPPLFLDATAFGAELARTAPGEAATMAARFLLSVFPPPVIAANPSVLTMLRAFFDSAAEPDGCIEVVAGIDGQCAILQGWGRTLGPGGEVVLAGASLRSSPAQEATFARADIKEPSTGHVLILPPTALAAEPIKALYLLANEGLRRRTLLADPRCLSNEETAGHLRDLLPTLRADAGTRATLAAALRPVYSGRLTLYDSAHPVRLSIDVAATASEAGLYLTGWLYDPANVIERVYAKQGSGTLRLDARWTRVLRPDVTEAFAADRTLPLNDPAGFDHGFAVHLPEWNTRADGHSYLEVVFKDGWCGFMPLSCVPVQGEAGRLKLLASIDLYKPSGLAVIEQQLAPFLSRIPAAPASHIVVDPVPSCTTLLLVPLPVAEQPRAFLAHLLVEPLASHEALVLVCGENWTGGDVASLVTLARFYGAAISIARVEGVASAANALRVVANVPAMEQVLLLGAGTVGRTKGWRQALETVAREHGGTACVSPSVLYEDGSVQFAGFGPMQPLAATPYIKLPRHFAGFPAAAVEAGQTITSAGVTAACCLIPRWVVQHLAVANTAAVAAWESELGLLLQLRAASPDCLWTQSVQVYAPEDTPAGDLARSADRLVARWAIRAALSPKEAR